MPSENRKPVTSRRTLLLFRSPTNWVKPSSNKGETRIIPIEIEILDAIVKPTKFNKRAVTTPRQMPVHLAHSGLAWPNILMQRSFFLWQNRAKQTFFFQIATVRRGPALGSHLSRIFGIGPPSLKE